MFNVQTYGATGDGTTNDQPSILAAVLAAQTAGGGVVYFPKGTYLLGTSETVDIYPPGPPVLQEICLPITGDNLFLRGDGPGVSVLKLGNGVNAVMVGFGECRNVGIEKLELDGNRSNQTTIDPCLYDFIEVEDLLIEDLYIHHASQYGIGLQHAPIVGCVINRVLIEDTGSDGMDIKNSDLGNRTNRMSHVTVRRAGLNTSLSGQVGIDVRGRWTLDNIHVEDFKNDGTNAVCLAGIRFRPDGSNGASGGNYSTLSNFYIEPSSSTATIGVQLAGYRDSIGAGIVKGCGSGVEFAGVENTSTGVNAVSCGNGFYKTDEAEHTTIVGGVSRSATNAGYKVYGDYAILSGIRALSNKYGIQIMSGANHTGLSGMSIGNSTSNLSNSGTNTHDRLDLP